YTLSFVSFLVPLRSPPQSPLFPYTTLFRSRACELYDTGSMIKVDFQNRAYVAQKAAAVGFQAILFTDHETPEQVEESIRLLSPRSEEHTSELQSRFDLVCRLLLEKKKIIEI